MKNINLQLKNTLKNLIQQFYNFIAVKVVVLFVLLLSTIFNNANNEILFFKKINHIINNFFCLAKNRTARCFGVLCSPAI